MTERLRELLGKANLPWHRGTDNPNGDWFVASTSADGVDTIWAPGIVSAGPTATLIVEAVNALPALLDAHDRMAAALRRVAETAHDYALGDWDDGLQHSATPWTVCPAEVCELARAALAVPKEENPRG